MFRLISLEYWIGSYIMGSRLLTCFVMHWGSFCWWSSIGNAWSQPFGKLTRAVLLASAGTAKSHRQSFLLVEAFSLRGYEHTKIQHLKDVQLSINPPGLFGEWLGQNPFVDDVNGWCVSSGRHIFLSPAGCYATQLLQFAAHQVVVHGENFARDHGEGLDDLSRSGWWQLDRVSGSHCDGVNTEMIVIDCHTARWLFHASTSPGRDCALKSSPSNLEPMLKLNE